MRQLVLLLLTGVVIGVGTGCGSATKQSRSAGNSFAEGVRLPERQELELANGLKVLFIKDKSLPRINIMALVGSGAIRDPKQKAGLSYLTASLMDEGSEKHTSAEIAEKLESLGADLSIQPGYDFTYLSMRGLSYTRETLLDSFLEILLSPKFAQTEVDRLKRQIQGALAKIEDNPDQFADHLFAKTLFKDHPYALPSMGDVASVGRIQRQDVIDFYKLNFVPKNTMVAVVGDFDDLFFQQVKTKLSTWISDAKPLAAVRVPSDSQAKGISLKVKSKKGLVQAQIRLGHLFIDRSHPDFLSLRAANLALGGAFASRLNQHVRDDLGLTYGISSSFDARRFSGPFMIDTFTRNDKVGEALAATLEVFKVFAEKGLTEEELQASKSVLIGQFPRAVETMDSLAYQMLALRYYGIDDSYLTHFVTNVKSLQLANVNSTLKKYFHPDQLEIVIYGDASLFETQLKKLGNVQKL